VGRFPVTAAGMWITSAYPATRRNPDYLDFVMSAIACFRQPSTVTDIEGTFLQG